jgi:beta-galactosidase
LSQTLIAEVLCTALVNASVDVIIMPKGVRISRRGEKSLVTNFNQHPVSWQGKTIPAVSYLIY